MVSLGIVLLFIYVTKNTENGNPTQIKHGHLNNSPSLNFGLHCVAEMLSKTFLDNLLCNISKCFIKKYFGRSFQVFVLYNGFTFNLLLYLNFYLKTNFPIKFQIL